MFIVSFIEYEPYARLPTMHDYRKKIITKSAHMYDYYNA